MDILMPEMSGLEAIRRIKFDYDDAKIIVISSLSEKKEMQKCLLSGASYYMIKPFEADKFVEVCNGVINGKIDIKILMEKILGSK
jgi:two-component system chemotaxis response regulator CheY